MYPTFLSFMHLGGKHSSIDSKPWPAIVVGFGVPYFDIFICALKTQNQKNEARIRRSSPALGGIFRGCGTELKIASWNLGSLKNGRRWGLASAGLVGRTLDLKPES